MKNSLIAFALSLLFIWGTSGECEARLVQQDGDRKAQSDRPRMERQRRNRKGGKGRRGGQNGGATELKKAEMAPDFELKSLDGKSTTKLSSFRGKKPVVLFFGSYT